MKIEMLKRLQELDEAHIDITVAHAEDLFEASQVAMGSALDAGAGDNVLTAISALSLKAGFLLGLEAAGYNSKPIQGNQPKGWDGGVAQEPSF